VPEKSSGDEKQVEVTVLCPNSRELTLRSGILSYEVQQETSGSFRVMSLRELRQRLEIYDWRGSTKALGIQQEIYFFTKEEAAAICPPKKRAGRIIVDLRNEDDWGKV
jgi:hypothetical protein